MNTPQQYNRQDYMNGKCSHREYYAQFVTPAVKQMVMDRIGLKELVRSTDEHLNDIPLNVWDNLAGSTRLALMRGDYSCTLRIADDNSLASQVCALKEAAKQIKEENAQ